jgi:UDP-glucose 4-epimerase
MHVAVPRLRLLVTGARGRVGAAVVTTALEHGHRVTTSDLGAPRYGIPGGPAYVRADLTDYGEAVGLIAQARPDVVINSAAIPAPGSDPPHVVFRTNALIAFNIAEAIARLGVPRLVNLSSETVPGFVTAERPWVPDYLPVDEEHPIRPQDAYALSKSLSEQIADALVRRSDATAVSVRPSYVLSPDMYAGVVPPIQSGGRRPPPNQWSYVDTRDLGELIVLAAEATTTGHEVVYAAQPDNLMGQPLADLLAGAYGDDAPPLRDLDRPDASGISIAKAREMFGWDPQRSWRDEFPAR